jgi:hypothetical protein
MKSQAAVLAPRGSCHTPLKRELREEQVLWNGQSRPSSDKRLDSRWPDHSEGSWPCGVVNRIGRPEAAWQVLIYVFLEVSIGSDGGAAPSTVTP